MSHKISIESHSEELSGDDLFAGLDHFKRVYRIAKELGENVDFDDAILHAACFMHDIVKSEQNHETESANHAREFLKTINFLPEKIEMVAEAIKSHHLKRKPESNEAKLLYDANLIDYLGVIGICRVTLASREWFGASEMSTVMEYMAQFQNKSDTLILPGSRRYAKDKLMLMNLIIKHMKREL